MDADLTTVAVAGIGALATLAAVALQFSLGPSLTRRSRRDQLLFERDAIERDAIRDLQSALPVFEAACNTLISARERGLEDSVTLIGLEAEVNSAFAKLRPSVALLRDSATEAAVRRSMAAPLQQALYGEVKSEEARATWEAAKLANPGLSPISTLMNESSERLGCQLEALYSSWTE